MKFCRNNFEGERFLSHPHPDPEEFERRDEAPVCITKEDLGNEGGGEAGMLGRAGLGPTYKRRCFSDIWKFLPLFLQKGGRRRQKIRRKDHDSVDAG